MLASLIALSPLLLSAAAPVALMLLVAYHRHHAHAALLTLLALALCLSLLPIAAYVSPRQITPLLIIDDYALVYLGLIFASGLAVAALSYDYREGGSGIHEELYILLLLAILGAGVLVAASHFASFFLGLELLSVSLFALIAYPLHQRRALEAGMKYLVLTGVSSSFLLFGMALVYADLGTLEFARMGERLAMLDTHPVYLLGGLALILTGVGFKLSLVPFHLWAPDVYEGAPAPISALLATISKGAVFALLLRYFSEAGLGRYAPVMLTLSIIAIASMFVGNLLALLQDNVKRLLAYSSIAHMGYLLVAFLAGGKLATEAVTFYLVAYFITTLGAFGVISVLSHPESGRDAERLSDYRGLFWRRPWMAGVFTAMLLSLAGIPLTAGFVGKFYAILAGAGSALWLLVAVLVVTSVIGLFYYLRVVVVMYAAPDGDVAEQSPASVTRVSPLGATVLAALTILLFALGVYPGPLMQMAQATAARLM